jgi:predicted nucleotidyltransferase
MEITSAKLETYRKTSRALVAVQQEQLERRQQSAWDVARRASAILKEQFGASRVVIFGSTLHPERFHYRSDIDLAVWDIKEYFRAVAVLLDIDPSFEFDLIPIEDARLAILELIKEEGVDL